MSDRDNYPLPPAVVKLLNDKLYDKRKAGALEIEKLIKEHLAKESKHAIEQMIICLGQNFANANTQQPRNGGLIGLAACAIALGKEACMFVEILVRPPLQCFTDSDSRIRYYACEALYNICKVTRGSVLTYFNEIFDGLSKLADDVDTNVRNGSELLDRLVKDIVTESSSFNVPAFIPLLRERIYTKKPFCKRFVVSWVALLNTVPDINMLVYLPEFLDGLLLILGEQSSEIKRMAEDVLKDYMIKIKVCTEKTVERLAEDDFIVDFPSMTNLLIMHSQSRDLTIQLYGIQWLKDFLELAGRKMVPFAPGILESALPSFSYMEDRKAGRDCGKQVNSLLMTLINNEDDDPSTSLLDTNAMVKVLSKLLLSESMNTCIASLRWFLHLFKTIPNTIFAHVNEIFPLLLNTLSDPSDEVVIGDLYLLAEIASNDIPAGKVLIGPVLDESVMASLQKTVSQYFIFCVHSLLKFFSSDRVLLEEKGFFIIRQFCLLLNAESVYRTMSELLRNEEDLLFASMMIRNLNIILLTATELFPLRNTLKQVDSEQGMSLFRCLYYSWCHNPVAAVALCFLTQEYKLAADLLQRFGDIDITVELLTEIDKLVQLLESPIFIYLRLQLLDSESNEYLVKALYSLLMLLPQSEAFKTLQNRLQCVPKIQAKQLCGFAADLLQRFKGGSVGQSGKTSCTEIWIVVGGKIGGLGRVAPTFQINAKTTWDGKEKLFIPKSKAEVSLRSSRPAQK